MLKDIDEYISNGTGDYHNGYTTYSYKEVEKMLRQAITDTIKECANKAKVITKNTLTTHKTVSGSKRIQVSYVDKESILLLINKIK